MSTSTHDARPKSARRRKLAGVAAIATCLTASALIATAQLGDAAAAAAAAEPTIEAASLQQDVDALVGAGVPGAILLVRDGDRTVRLTAGLGDVANKTAMRADDHFKIASLTKTYTATVVLQLVAEGKLRLSDSVERRLPGVVPNGQNITIRQLLNHTSGLADFEADPRYLEPYLSGDLGYYWSPRQLVEMAVSHEPLFAPGETEHASYSNTNYVVAGLIVENVTGRSIGAELKSRIFAPLKLRETTYPTRPGLPSPFAHGYMVLGAPPAIDVTELSHSMSPASGAIVSTAVDVADFYRGLQSGRLLRADLLKAMKTTISQGDKVDIPGQRYGLGLELFPTSCGDAWGHNGVVPGYQTFIFSTRNGRRQALLMMNHDSATAPPAAGKAFLEVIDKAFCSRV